MEPPSTYKTAPSTIPKYFKPPSYCKAIEPYVNPPDEEVPTKLQVSDPSKLLLLLRSLRGTSTRSLEVNINLYLKAECEATDVFQIFLIHVSEFAMVQVLTDKVLLKPLCYRLEDEVMASMVQFDGNTYTCAENLHPEIQKIFKKVLETRGDQIVAIPLISKIRNCQSNMSQIFGNPLILTCIVNPIKPQSFVTQCVQETFRYCLTILLNTLENEEQTRLKTRFQKLLNVARILFTFIDDLNKLLKEIMFQARDLTNAERCSLFLLDQEHSTLVAKVFDGVDAEQNVEVKISKNQGIAGHVAATGKILNIKNAYDHPLFYKGLDERTGFKTENILCFPIRDEKQIVGVAQICNKKDGSFNHFDVEMAESFSIYCGIAISHSLVYKQINDERARAKLSNELMMYHMQVKEEDIANVICCENNHNPTDFAAFSFIPKRILIKETPCFVLKMFEDLGFMSRFKIHIKILVKFTLFLKTSYRDVSYHNWMHAFSVAHFAYLCLKNFKIMEMGYLTHLEGFSFLLACLCHDVDHRGTTNQFQLYEKNTLSSLYSEGGSVMEMHHLNQALCILNTDGCNFLQNLTTQEYTLCLDLFKDMILATDISLHFKIFKKQQQLAEEGYDNTKPEHRFFLASLLMTCADLSDQTKDWFHTKKVCIAIYSEFFKQGDLEKKMGRKPMAIMDRDQANIPEFQIKFMKDMCLPLFDVLTTLFPEGQCIMDQLETSILLWEKAAPYFDQMVKSGLTSMEVLENQDLDMEVQEIIDAMNREKELEDEAHSETSFTENEYLGEEEGESDQHTPD